MKIYLSRNENGDLLFAFVEEEGYSCRVWNGVMEDSSDMLSDINLEKGPIEAKLVKINKGDLGQQIKNQRKKKGFSQKQLAEKLGISANAMCSIENGKAWPSRDTMDAICGLLEVELVLKEEVKPWCG